MNQKVTANLIYAACIIGFIASIGSIISPTYYLTIFTGIISAAAFFIVSIITIMIYEDKTIIISKSKENAKEGV